MEETSVRFAIIPLVGVDLPYRILGMATVGDAVGKIDTVIHRSRGQFRGKDKSVIRIHGGVLIESIMKNAFLDDPVRIQITRKLKEISVLVQLPFRGLSLLPLLLDLFVADGVAGGLNQAGIHGYPFVDGQPLPGEC